MYWPSRGSRSGRVMVLSSIRGAAWSTVSPAASVTATFVDGASSTSEKVNSTFSGVVSSFAPSSGLDSTRATCAAAGVAVTVSATAAASSAPDRIRRILTVG